MSVVIHNVDPSKPRETPLFEKVLKQRVHRQKGSRNLLFDEEYGNRKKVWNRWTGEQLNFTRKALRNMRRKRLGLNTRNNNVGNHNNINDIENANVMKANLNNPEWQIGIGNLGYERVPNILKPNRTLRRKRFVNSYI